MLIFSAFLIVLAAYCVKKLCDFLKMLHLYNKFDGPKASSFIFGHWSLIRQPPETLFKNFNQLAKQYYPHWAFRILNECVLVAFSPEDCEIFLSTSKHTRKSLMYKIFSRWLRDGLLLSSGEKWAKRRKILTPAFHFTILKDFIEVFNESTDQFMKTLKTKGTEEIDVVPLIQEFSFAAIKETAMGHKSKEDDKKHDGYRKALSRMEYLFNQCLVRPWLAIYAIYIFTSIHWEERRMIKILHDYTQTIIKKKMANFDENATKKTVVNDDGLHMVNKNRKHMAMLDILIQAHRNKEIDYEGICEEVDTFTFEGHDTVSSAMSFCLMTIANHPEIQDQVLEEINSVLGKGNRHSTYEDLNKMELLERCIKETLRLYPSVHLVSRTIDEDTVLHSGLVAPKNGMVHIPIACVHRNPEIYPDPEKFDPDRFLPENCQHRHPFAYIPFSAGPRNCIGQRFAMLEMKVLLSAIIKHFQLVPVDTAQTIELRMETILRSTNGIKVKFIPRIKKTDKK